MRIVVTGREGQVVRSLVERAAGTDLEIVALGRPQLDLAGSFESITSAIKAACPDIIVSAAAYTQVDKAETERDLAFAVNERGPRAIAFAASELDVPLVHLSTDYVFDGLNPAPYVEEDPAGPTGVYGESKLAGEKAVLAEHGDSVVLRTAWVYSPFGSNFVKSMLRLAGDREELAVVADQLGNPSSALDIADGIIEIARNLATSRDPVRRGVFHMAGAGEASWAEFAEGIFAVSETIGGPTARVRRIDAADYPTIAKRPANSRLDCGKLARIHGVRLPDWRNSVEQVVGKLLEPVAKGGVN
jgi:dTDP-4-dehydrorhamnose reductase